MCACAGVIIQITAVTRIATINCLLCTNTILITLHLLAHLILTPTLLLSSTGKNLGLNELITMLHCLTLRKQWSEAYWSICGFSSPPTILLVGSIHSADAEDCNAQVFCHIVRRQRKVTGDPCPEGSQSGGGDRHVNTGLPCNMLSVTATLSTENSPFCFLPHKGVLKILLYYFQ